MWSALPTGRGSPVCVLYAKMINPYVTLSDREVLVASPVPVTLSVNVTPSLYSPESDGFPSLACSCRPWLYTAMFLTCFGFDNLCCSSCGTLWSVKTW